METIKNYLEAMFANLPNSPEVHKAKKELSQMMEDKYTELIAEGKSENEAVGTVISEFGNLEELSEDLNLTDEMTSFASSEDALNRRFVSMDEIKEYVNAEMRSANHIGAGVFLCITSVIWPIILRVMNIKTHFGGMFIMAPIAVAVALFIYNSNNMKQWDFMHKNACQIDMNTANYIGAEKRKYMGSHALLKTVGVILCALCWLPSAFIDDIPFIKNEFGGAMLFIMIGIGVFLLIKARKTNRTYETILSLNNMNTVSGSYYKDKAPSYINDNIANVMSVYWPTVTCIYFIWSFLTFDWMFSWIIWPIAGVVAKIIDTTLIEKK